MTIETFKSVLATANDLKAKAREIRYESYDHHEEGNIRRSQELYAAATELDDYADRVIREASNNAPSGWAVMVDGLSFIPVKTSL